MRIKTAISLFVSASLLFSAAGAAELEKAGVITAANKLTYAAAQTPKEDKFTVEGKGFILLDSGSDGALVMTEELYGTSSVDRTPGISANSSTAKFDAEDENNIAYWLNNDFLTYGNGEYALPSDIAGNIVTHTWETEPCNAAGFTSQYEQEMKIALLSDNEYRKYAGHIGHTPSDAKAVSFYLRTACADGVGQNACYALAVSFKTPGTTVSPKATVAQYIRPVFYLSYDFFNTVHLDDIGENVLMFMNENCRAEDIRSVYSAEEISKYFPKPAADNVSVAGDMFAGAKLSAEYVYDYIFDEGESTVTWYMSETQDGTYTAFAHGKEITLTEGTEGKYIKVSVVPVGTAGANNTGEEAFSGVYGPVEGAASLLDTLNTCDFDTLNALLPSVLDEEKLAVYDSLGAQGKELVFGARRECGSISAFADMINKETARAVMRFTDIKNALPSFMKVADEFDIKSADNEYIAALTALSIYGREYAGFSQLRAEAASVADELLARQVNGEELLGLGKANRIGQGSPIEGALRTTPEENIFSFGGKDFIILDTCSAAHSGDHIFVMTKDYYGTRAVDTTPGRAEADAEAKYDCGDENNIAYWLNHDFIFSGNGGNVLPEALIRYMDVKHIWHTEPSNVPNYGKEHMDVGPLALMADYEWHQYIKEFGLDTQLTSSGAYFRTARAGAVTATVNNLMTYFGGEGTTLEQNVTRPAYLRPVFYLDVDFFANNKLTFIGERASRLIQDCFDASVIESLYSKAETEALFARPQVSGIKISGSAVTGSRLTVSYDISSVYPESSTKIEWLRSDTKDGEKQLIKEAKELIIDDDLSGKYITVRVTPVSTAKINPQGEAAEADEILGPIAASADVTAEFKAADKDSIFDVINKNAALIGLDADMTGITDTERLAKIILTCDMSSVDSVKSGIKRAVIIERINEAGEAEIPEYLAQSDIGADTEHIAAMRARDKFMSAVSQTEFLSEPDFCTDMYKLMAMSEFSECDRAAVRDFLKYYDFLFTADISALSDARLGEAGIQLLKSSPKTFDELDKCVSAAIAADANTGQGSTTRVSSGGGGGSSSGTVSGYKTVTQSQSGGTAAGGAGSTTNTGAGVSGAVFNDIDGVPWAKEQILSLAGKGIIAGVGGGAFMPDAEVTREEFVKMIVSAFGIDADGADISFTDVEDGAWYSGHVRRAAAAGIINGTGDGAFGIGMSITRQDIAAVGARLLALDPAEPPAFYDADSISDYAVGAVGALCACGIINGFEDNTFRAQDHATRAQAAVIIYGLMQHGKAGE